MGGMRSSGNVLAGNPKAKTNARETLGDDSSREGCDGTDLIQLAEGRNL